jgi:site-specific DNA-methyltransferase (adenine-specific)
MNPRAIAYRSRHCTIYHGDAREFLPGLERDSVDLLCTDPPYGVAFNSGSRTEEFGVMLGDDGSLDVLETLKSGIHALRKSRHVYVFGYTAEQLAAPLCLGATAEIVWDKGEFGMGNLSIPWGSQHESILFGSYIPSQAEREKGRGQLTARLRRGSVLSVNRKCGNAVTRHPTEKPVALMRQLIESSTVMGDTVLDPFAGSGSTLVAAIVSGRKAVGIELDGKYLDVMLKRVREAEELAREIERL